ARFAEENEAKKALAELEKLDVDSEKFMTTFAAFRVDVLEHARQEELEEFAAVEAAADEEELADLAKRLERAEKLAPTHPHPSAKTTGTNVVLGPFAAMVDKIRDAMS